MTDVTYLNDHFLIATPSLKDPNFERSVTYLCQHNDGGALGIVINRSSHLQVGEILEQLDIKCTTSSWSEQAVLVGGPVHRDRGFVLHDCVGEWDSSIRVSDELALTTSRDILEALADGRGPSRAVLALGYAGWSAGQLEGELRENAWLAGPADPGLIFDMPVESRWQGATKKLGIDPAQLTGFVGHA